MSFSASTSVTRRTAFLGAIVTRSIGRATVHFVPKEKLFTRTGVAAYPFSGTSKAIVESRLMPTPSPVMAGLEPAIDSTHPCAGLSSLPPTFSQPESSIVPFVTIIAQSFSFVP